jgi:hypothetical protein
MKWTNKSNEYNELAKKILEFAETNKFYIWGAGFFGDAVFAPMQGELDIIGYIDSNPDKQGKIMNGCPIFSPNILNDLENAKITILISAGENSEIYSELARYGYIRNVNCFHIDDFVTIYFAYKYGKVYLCSVGITLTERCTLKCKNCLNFIPYIKMPKNFTLKEIQHQLHVLFSSVDYVVAFQLSGADAIMNPNHKEIIDYVGGTYLNRNIGTLEFLSNGVILPDSEIIELLKKYNMYFRFTDYNLPQQNIVTLVGLLENNNIRYDHVRFDYWLDNGYPQQSNGKTTDEQLIAHFNSCDRRSCQGIIDGKFYYCSTGYWAERSGYCSIEKEDYYCLEPFDGDKKALIEFALGYSEKGYINYCRKCNGGFNSNKLQISVGVQL